MVIKIMMWFCCGHHVQDGLKPAWPSTGNLLTTDVAGLASTPAKHAPAYDHASEGCFTADAVPTCGAAPIPRRRAAPYTVPRVVVRHGDAAQRVRATPHPV